MNHHFLPPLGIMLIAGLIAPYLLGRARWAHQVPRLAVVMWGVLAISFICGVSLTAAQLILPRSSSHKLMELADAVFPWSDESFRFPSHGLLHPDAAEAWAALAAMVVPLLIAALLVRELVRARRTRNRHADLLHLVGNREPRLRATVVAHGTPVVYCLPGRNPQVVISSGARDVLTDSQLTAVLAHERAHVSGRDHLLVAAVQAFGTLFRGIPLARCAQRELPLLLEMAADDQALRSCSRDALATALYAMAARQAPRAAFAAGGPTAAIRMRRILTPDFGGHPVLRALAAAFACAGALAPLVMACCSIPG